MGGGVEERARELGAGAVVGAGRLAAFQAVARPLARTQRILRRRSLSRSSGHVLMSPDWRVSRSQQAPSLAGSPGHAWHSRALAGHWPVARAAPVLGRSQETSRAGQGLHLLRADSSHLCPHRTEGRPVHQKDTRLAPGWKREQGKEATSTDLEPLCPSPFPLPGAPPHKPPGVSTQQVLGTLAKTK